jgi:hypothetical protein
MAASARKLLIVFLVGFPLLILTGFLVNVLALGKGGYGAFSFKDIR